MGLWVSMFPYIDRVVSQLRLCLRSVPAKVHIC